MSAELVALILGIAFLGLLVLILFRFARPGVPVTAEGSFAGAKIKLSVGQRQEAEEHLTAAAKDRGGNPAAAAKQLSQVSAIEPTRILWVDDQPDVNLSENLMLQALGLSVMSVTSSAAAKRCLETGMFDLLITDLTRPDTATGADDRDAGLQLLRDLKVGANPIKRIVYALQISEREGEARGLGASAVETTPDGLLRAVLDVVTRATPAEAPPPLVQRAS